MITPDDRAFLARLCADRTGLRIDPDKAYLLESRLAPVARREGFASLEHFVDAVRRAGEDRLAWAAAEALAPCETAFFRDPAVFQRLTAEVLPELVRARGGGPVRVWCAACGTGQEIYSLAMALAEDAPLAARVELFASDLSDRSLEKAQAGLYSQFEVQRGLPARKLVRHFEKRGDLFALSPRIRQTVRWRRVNLADDLAPLGRFDLVVCRNVLGAFTAPGRGRALANLAGALSPGGRLVLGRGEPASGLIAVSPDIGLYAPIDEAVRTAA